MRSGERPLAVDMLRPWERKSPFFGLLARRLGFTAARLFERSRQAGFHRRMRERAEPPVRRFLHPTKNNLEAFTSEERPGLLRGFAAFLEVIASSSKCPTLSSDPTGRER